MKSDSIFFFSLFSLVLGLTLMLDVLSQGEALIFIRSVIQMDEFPTFNTLRVILVLTPMTSLEMQEK